MSNWYFFSLFNNSSNLRGCKVTDYVRFTGTVRPNGLIPVKKRVGSSKGQKQIQQLDR